MKSYYKLTIHGDSDVDLDGYPLESIVYYFEEFDKLLMIDKLEKFLKLDIKDGIGHKECSKFLIKAVRATISQLKSSKEDRFIYGYGGNQFVSIEQHFYPEEDDFNVLIR